MTDLFDRAWSVQIGTVRISSDQGVDTLAVRFEVVKSTRREPNTCNIQMANLTPQRRTELQELERPQIQIDAGYVGLTDTIFVGDARDIWSQRDGTEVWTIAEAEDGGTSYRTATIQQALGNSITVARVIEICAEAMGVGIGNARTVAADAELPSGANQYAQGTVLSGRAHRVLDRVCRSASLRWSVQNGVLQLRNVGQPAEERSIRLSPGSGLLGSPTRGKRDNRTRRVTVTAKAQLIPGLYPGRVVVLDSSEVQGGWQIKRVRYTGDTAGQDWLADLELEEY
jgi:hypothetical protein